MTRQQRRRLARAALAAVYLENWRLDVARKAAAGRYQNHPNPRKYQAALRAARRA